MRQITGIQATGGQKFRMRLDDGRPVDFNLYYRQAVQMWFLSVTFEGRTIENLRVCASLNLLRQYRLPFGLFVETQNQGEPTYINDFRDEVCNLYLLNESEIEALQEAYRGATA